MRGAERLARSHYRYQLRLVKAAELRKRAEEIESGADEYLENEIAYALDSDKITLASARRSLGWSNVKVKAWADKARKRNTELLRKGTN